MARHDITIKLHDTVGFSTSQRLMNIINSDELQNMDIKVQVYDTSGVFIEEWIVNGIIRSVDFGRLTYYNDQPISITMDIAVNFATLNN